MRLPALLAAICLAAPAAAHAGPASDAVKFFYVPEVRFEANPKYRDRFTEPVTKLFELNDELQRKNPDQIACIDFDPGLDAQDFDQETLAKTLKLRESVNGDEGTVTATFTLFPDADEDGAREMVWSLKKIDGAWKIADIESRTNGWTLSQLMCLGDEGPAE
jgi:hypothetical protein